MLKDWIESNALDCNIMTEGVIETPIGIMIEIVPEEGEKLFNANFELNVSSTDRSLAEQTDATNYVFEFGGKYYYTPIDSILDPKLNLFKYLGEASLKKFNWPFLGIHGKYELMNGTRDYSDWCKKAKFYGMNTLGICEHSTLGGALKFQMACKSNGIKPIIGASYTVERNNTKEYDIKLYAMNPIGWRNLLRVNKEVNIDNAEDRIIYERDLINKYGEGLVCVLSPVGKYSMGNVIDMLNRADFEKVFMQFDPTEMLSDDRDREKLERLKYYLDNFRHLIDPILITDAYYLDKEDYKIKDILNNVGSVKGQFASDKQYFKHLIDVMTDLDTLFSDTDGRYDMIIKDGYNNCKWISDNCEFEIEVGKRHLPKFEMNEDQKEKYKTNKGMFIGLLEEGIQSKMDMSKYTEDEVYDRLEKEVKVIVGANVHDYFLILWDIVQWCNEKEILTGIGRGSAGGCLCSYLLGIIKINPLDYDLLFERFLNEGRAMKSLPDIDTDFEGKRRGEVKRYMEQKYGLEYVASIGTYTTLQMRAAMKDLNRAIGKTDNGSMNYISQIFDGGKWGDLFTEAVQKPQLKKWILDNPEIINMIPLCYNSPKSQSVHACATIIAPKEGGYDVFDRLPMRQTEDGMLVTEWEGGEIEAAGFLKEDILGIIQLDKFRMIINLIKENTGKVIDIEDIPLDDVDVLNLFGSGYNKDVFQFGSAGLSAYMRAVKPSSIDDLINSNALYRPGAMASNAHIDYVKMKEGEKVPTYDYMLKEVTKDTFGLYIFQEQVMKACQILGGFSLAEADDIRKAMGKKKIDLLLSYEERFIQSAVDQGCPSQEAADIWKKLVAFAGYGFNKSHAAAYAITSYICNWFKWHYPTQFWVTALEFSKDPQIPGFINEIHKTGSIEIMPPDINNSDVGFVADYEEERIFWSISKIKHVGISAVQEILDKRKEGDFTSMEDFLNRIEKKKVNKRAVTNMILAGCFDMMYKVDKHSDRKQILQELYDIRKEKEKDYVEWFDSKGTNYDWFWTLKQHEVSGLGDMSYKKALSFSDHLGSRVSGYVDPEEFYSEDSIGKSVVIGGIITEVKEKKIKKGMMGTITIDCNSEPIQIRVWPDRWESKNSNDEVMRQVVTKSKGRILFISGKVCGPSQWNPDNIMQSISEGRSATKWDVL